MKKFFIMITCAMALSACSSDDDSSTLCDCEPDEYCVGDVCHPTNSSIAPAPDEK